MCGNVNDFHLRWIANKRRDDIAWHGRAAGTQAPMPEERRKPASVEEVADVEEAAPDAPEGAPAPVNLTGGNDNLTGDRGGRRPLVTIPPARQKPPPRQPTPPQWPPPGHGPAQPAQEAPAAPAPKADGVPYPYSAQMVANLMQAMMESQRQQTHQPAPTHFAPPPQQMQFGQPAPQPQGFQPPAFMPQAQQDVLMHLAAQHAQAQSFYQPSPYGTPPWRQLHSQGAPPPTSMQPSFPQGAQPPFPQGAQQGSPQPFPHAWPQDIFFGGQILAAEERAAEERAAERMRNQAHRRKQERAQANFARKERARVRKEQRLADERAEREFEGDAADEELY